MSINPQPPGPPPGRRRGGLIGAELAGLVGGFVAGFVVAYLLHLAGAEVPWLPWLTAVAGALGLRAAAARSRKEP